MLGARVNLATEKATVTYHPFATGVSQMIQKVEATGYRAAPLNEVVPALPVSRPLARETSQVIAPPAASTGEHAQDQHSLHKRRELARKRNALLLGSVLSLPIMILSMLFMNRFPGENLLLLVLTTPVWAIVG